MAGNPVPLLRVWRLQPWNRNPLMRGTDRCQAVIRLLVIALLLIVVPVAGAAGTAGYTRTADRIESESAAKTLVTATLVTDSTLKPGVGEYQAGRYEAQVSWRRNGNTDTGTATLDTAAAIGSDVQVWLDADGRLAAPPPEAGTAVGDAVGIALTVLVIGWGGAMALHWGVVWLLDGLRSQRWDAEWRAFARPIGTD
ncbi:Rv1733c family protein [Nocardia sp. IFM 10818]